MSEALEELGITGKSEEEFFYKKWKSFQDKERKKEKESAEGIGSAYPFTTETIKNMTCDHKERRCKNSMKGVVGKGT